MLEEMYLKEKKTLPKDEKDLTPEDNADIVH